MSRAPASFPPYHGRAAFRPETLAHAERLLVARWDPDGTIARAMAARPEGPDPTRPRTMADAALEACGILAAGGPEAQVSGYLKREEMALLQEPADDAELVARRERRQRVAAALWRLVRGITEPGDSPDVPAPGDGPRGTRSD